MCERTASGTIQRYISALDKHKDVQNQLLQLQKELRSIETKKNVQKLISKASEKFYGLIGKTVNDRKKMP